MAKINYIFKEIGESLSGKERDYTKENLKRAIFLLSIPMILEMAMESIFAIADIYFVSKISPEAVATVGLTESLMTIVYSISFGLSVAASAIISRRIGENNKEKASKTAVQAIFSGVFVSIIIGLPGLLFASEILRFIGASENVIFNYSGYASIMFGSNIVITLLFIINGIFRSAGDPAISMRVLWVSNVINIILDPILIFGWWIFPQMGIEGAATATAIGRGVGVIYQFYILFKRKSRINLNLKMFKLDFEIIKKIFRLSVGSIGQNIISTSSWIGLMAILATFGSLSVAGYTIAIRIIIFSLLPSWGISNAAGTLVGQNLGAEQPDRAEKSVWITGKYNLIVLGIIGIIYILIPDFWISLLTSDKEVIQKGAEALRIVSYGFLAYGYGMVVLHAFNGAGDTTTPTKINIICFWFVEIPLAYLLSKILNFGEQGVFYSIVIAETCLTIISIIIFKKGKWKIKIV
ncbi:MATE family efflux transporter [Bacteroidetes/Chlorobi group bacterium ChocPot_Mid]|nr:MAG: MATE family efflux transporter [Bacteroidetes/Chlorobi group bacterium ChocPot_Mid]